MNIFLVRHGQSEGNEDPSIYINKADHAISLSKKGHSQVKEAGHFLCKFLKENDFQDEKIRLWTSPYLRTRQTAEAIKKACADIITDTREDILLCEQQFGIFDGIDDEELHKKYPVEHKHYQKAIDHEGKFWARIPLGESRFDVALRIRLFFGTIQRDAEKNGIHNIIVICHGVTLRAFVMSWMHRSPEWFDKQRNPKNCAIRLLRDREDKGFIFVGFK